MAGREEGLDNSDVRGKRCDNSREVSTSDLHSLRNSPRPTSVLAFNPNSQGSYQERALHLSSTIPLRQFTTVSRKLGYQLEFSTPEELLSNDANRTPVHKAE